MKLNFPEPELEGYTVYCKSACINCEKSKGLLKGAKAKAKFIYCDLYVDDSFCRLEFLEFIKLKCGFPNRLFPMIFKDGQYLGCYWELYDDLNVDETW
jgi:hypothetical protein